MIYTKQFTFGRAETNDKAANAILTAIGKSPLAEALKSLPATLKSANTIKVGDILHLRAGTAEVKKVTKSGLNTVIGVEYLSGNKKGRYEYKELGPIVKLKVLAKRNFTEALNNISNKVDKISGAKSITTLLTPDKVHSGDILILTNGNKVKVTKVEPYPEKGPRTGKYKVTYRFLDGDRRGDEDSHVYNKEQTLEKLTSSTRENLIRPNKKSNTLDNLGTEDTYKPSESETQDEDSEVEQSEDENSEEKQKTEYTDETAKKDTASDKSPGYDKVPDKVYEQLRSLYRNLAKSTSKGYSQKVYSNALKIIVDAINKDKEFSVNSAWNEALKKSSEETKAYTEKYNTDKDSAKVENTSKLNLTDIQRKQLQSIIGRLNNRIDELAKLSGGYDKEEIDLEDDMKLAMNLKDFHALMSALSNIKKEVEEKIAKYNSK